METNEHKHYPFEEKVWNNFYRSLQDLGRIDTAYSAKKIAEEIYSVTSIPLEIVEGVVIDAMDNRENFDSLHPRVASTIAELLTSGVSVILWTVGDPQTQQKKADMIKQKVKESLVESLEEEKAQELLGSSFGVKISDRDKSEVFREIMQERQSSGKTKAVVVDDKQENIDNATQISEEVGIYLANFKINKDDSRGSFEASIPFVENLIEEGLDLVIYDIDDTLLNETGKGGRIDKIASEVSQKLGEITTQSAKTSP